MEMVRAKVKAFVVKNFLFGDAGGLGDDTSFLKNGIIDSTGVLELVAFLESEFSFSVADNELVPENLDSLANIEAFVTRKLSLPAADLTTAIPAAV